MKLLLILTGPQGIGKSRFLKAHGIHEVHRGYLGDNVSKKKLLDTVLESPSHVCAITSNTVGVKLPEYFYSAILAEGYKLQETTVRSEADLMGWAKVPFLEHTGEFPRFTLSTKPFSFSHCINQTGALRYGYMKGSIAVTDYLALEHTGHYLENERHTIVKVYNWHDQAMFVIIEERPVGIEVLNGVKKVKGRRGAANDRTEYLIKTDTGASKWLSQKKPNIL